MSHEDIDRFDRWAPHYERSWMQTLVRWVQDATVDAALGEVAHPTRVLDVGCGTGRLLRHLASRCPRAELVGVDPAPGMVRQALEAAPPDRTIEFTSAQAEHLPFPDGDFDLVLSTISFHHWHDQPEGLRQVRRVLVPGGVFALADPLRTAFWARPLLALLHGRFHDPAGLDALLRGSGLSVVRRVAVPRTAGVVQVTLSRAI